MLPPVAAAGLQALLVGPDPQQRQLAAMLLGCMQAAGVESLLAARAQFAQAATHSSGTDVGTDLLQTDPISFLSELPSFASESLSRSTHDNAVLSAEQLPLQPQQQQQQLVKQLLPAQATTPATVLYRQQSTDSGDTPPEFSTPSLPGLPSPAHRQLSSGGQQPPRHRPPLPGGRPGSSASSTRSHAALRAQQAQQQASGQFWRPESAASPELASPFGRAHSAISDAFASELGVGVGDLRSSGSGGLAAAGNTHSNTIPRATRCCTAAACMLGTAAAAAVTCGRAPAAGTQLCSLALARDSMDRSITGTAQCAWAGGGQTRFLAPPCRERPGHGPAHGPGTGGPAQLRPRHRTSKP